MTGELKRGFLKHKVFGAVFAVEQDETGLVLAAAPMHEAIACRHRLSEYILSLDEATEIAKHIRDYEVFEPPCADPTHLLADIGTAEKECQVAESEWTAAHAHAKALKDIFELKVDALREIITGATSPKPMPLFDQPAA